ncbi:MAG: winged helix-turn-helix domain-containing protein [Kangiellaceae bacterium]|nr:winged helix-turn-helix domain-containing protein [Kangiellaceae bacterium]MCW8997597.1 winged helix-turn-helix domain-containing protein [Kangiellaceae bacterium]MCW9016067.1 winged helix-turn-helix domain-containing protein [Kangiellaceae bacterium]
MNSKHWTFFSNHAHVLICLVKDPEVKLRDVAQDVGITERAVQRIVAELEEAEVIKRHKVGRRNHYEIHLEQRLRHPLESHNTLESIINVIVD